MKYYDTTYSTSSCKTSKRTLPGKQISELDAHIEWRINLAVEEVKKWQQDPRYTRRQIEVYHLEGREPYFSIKNQQISAAPFIEDITDKLAGIKSRFGGLFNSPATRYTSDDAETFRVIDEQLVKFNLGEFNRTKYFGNGSAEKQR